MPSSISYSWNFGSLLGICLMIQIISGFFLTFHYQTSISMAFESVSICICENTKWGWLLRSIHANGASFFFIFIYIHIYRGLMFKSYFLNMTWWIGSIVLLLLMGTAFLGYVLPWGQMSFWGATVITNLLSAIPFIGETLVQWVWGGFSVGEPTLERFFSIHYILPFIILIMASLHIISLHEGGSSNPLGIDQNSDKIFFHPLFSYKDMIGIMIFFCFFLLFSINYNDWFMDPDNFSVANPLSTPPHIQPEWYFLFAYTILRSTPTKLGGVVALMLSVCILFFFPMKKKNFWSYKSIMTDKLMNNLLISCFIILTWIGKMPVEFPMEMIGKMFSIIYFFTMFILIMF